MKPLLKVLTTTAASLLKRTTPSQKITEFEDCLAKQEDTYNSTVKSAEAVCGMLKAGKLTVVYYFTVGFIIAMQFNNALIH